MNWNTKEFLLSCLESLHRYPAKIPCEITVADNASSDGSAAAVRKLYPGVGIIGNRANYGYARANNQLFAASRGAKFLMLNPDTLVTGGALDAMAGCIDSHPDAAAVCPAFLNPDGSFQRHYRRFPGLRDFIGRLYLLSSLLPRAYKDKIAASYGYRRPDDTFNAMRVVEQAGTSCLMVRSSLFRQEGLFDERFGLFFNDVDLARRICLIGLKTYFLPEARIVHFLGKGRSPDRTVEAQEFFVSFLRYMRKHDAFMMYLCAKALLAADFSLLGFIDMAQIVMGRKKPADLRKEIIFRLNVLRDRSIF